MAILYPRDFNKNVLCKAVSSSMSHKKLTVQWQKAAFGPAHTAEHICVHPTTSVFLKAEGWHRKLSTNEA